MKRNLRYYLLLACTVLLYEGAQAQLVQKSQTTSNGGGKSTGTNIEHFSVAGQPAIGRTTGGTYQMNSGFIHTLTNPFPAAPTEFLVRPLSETSIQVSFVSNSILNGTTYALERSTSDDFSTDLVGIPIPLNSTEYVDNISLSADTYYYYRLKAAVEGRESDYVYDGTATFSGTLDDLWYWASYLQTGSYGRTVANDANGNAYVGGYVQGDVTVGVQNWVVASGQDAFIIKYDPDGNILWGQQLASTATASVEEVKIDANGVLYVTGYFSGQLTIPNGPTLVSQGANDGFVLKMNAGGQTLWAKRIGGTAGDIITAHSFDGSGNIHLLYSSGSVNGSFGASSLNAGLHIVTISPIGNFVRTKPVSTDPGVTGNDLAVDAQGNIFVVGGFSNSPTIAGTGLASTGGTDIYYAKFNNSGDPLWVKQASTANADNAFSVAVNANGVYVAGFFDGATLNVPSSTATNAGDRDGFILAANSADGSTQWVRSMGGAGSDGVLALTTDTNGQLLVAGFMGIDDLLFPPSAEVLRNGFGFYALYDAAGAVLGVDKVEGKSNNMVSNRAISVFGNSLYATGRFLGAAEFGQLSTLNSGGDAAMFLGKYKYQEVCDTPVSFSVSNVTTTTADLSWNIGQYPDGDALTYSIRYKPFGTLTWTEVTQSGTSLQLTSLEPGVKYLVQVNMTCTGGQVLTSPYTPVVEFTTAGAPTCVVPVIASDASISDTQHQVTWSDTSPLSYSYRYRLKGTFVWTTVTGETTINPTISGLSAGMTYQIQVKGICTGIETVYSPLYEFTTSGTTVCVTPSGLSVSGITTSGASISWTNQSAESYEVRYKVNGTTIWTTESVVTNSITLANLEPGSIYVYTVRAICNATSGLASPFTTTAQFTTTGAPSCVVPVGLGASVTTNSATLGWTASTGAVGYDVRYRVQGTTVWTYVQSFTNTKELTGLSTGTAYQYQVRSICTIDGTFVSLYSSTYVFTTSGAVACVAPTALQATPSTTTAVLSWAAQAGVTGYQVRYRLEGSTVWAYETVTTNSLAISSLTSGMPYMWTVRSICNAEGTLASPFATNAFFETTGVVACQVPTNVTANNITSATADLTWGDMSASSYQIRYRVAGTPIWTLVPIVSPMYTLTGLESGTPYQVQVKSLCTGDGSVQSLFSSVVAFETSGTVSCEVPVNLVSSNITTSSATVSWTTVAAASNGYELRYRVKGTALWTIVMAGTNSYDLTNLEPGLAYQFSVKSNCSTSPLLTSVYSVPAEFSTQGLPNCIVPTGFSVSATDTDADIAWDNAGALSYDVRVRVSGSTLWTNLNTGTNSISLGSLQTGTNYQYQVRSVCAADGSIKSLYSGVEFFSTTGTISCETPTGLVASAITDTGAQIDWVDAGGADRYDFRFRVKGTTIWSQADVATAGALMSSLESGMPYQVRVRTICSVDNSLVSPYSSILEFTTTGATTCEIPVGLTVVSTGETTADLSWTPSNGALSYELLYRKQGDIIWTATTAGTPSISLTGLTSITNYQWKVRTVCSADNSLKSQYSTVSDFGTIAAPGARVSDGDGTEVAMGLEEVLAAFEVVIYPNPSPDDVFFRLTPPQSDVFSLSVFNMAGQEVHHLFEGMLSKDEQVEFLWYTGGVPSGTYIFKLSNGNGLEIARRIILTH